MTFDEYEASINIALANPDTAPAEIMGVLENLKTDLIARDDAIAKNGEYESRIRDLQDTNMRLYLSVGGGQEDPEEPEKATGAEVINEFMDELFKEEN